MNKLLIIVDYPPSGDDVASLAWRDALHELQDRKDMPVTEIWPANNVALIEATTGASQAMKILSHLRKRGVRYTLWMAGNCPDHLVEHFEIEP